MTSGGGKTREGVTVVTGGLCVRKRFLEWSPEVQVLLLEPLFYPVGRQDIKSVHTTRKFWVPSPQDHAGPKIITFTHPSYGKADGKEWPCVPPHPCPPLCPAVGTCSVPLTLYHTAGFLKAAGCILGGRRFRKPLV